jgi:adenylate cyclase
MQDSVAQADETSIRAELDRILASGEFAGSERHRRFLTYIVEETLAGRGDRLKAYNIATAAFNRGEDFDPQQDSIVRIEAGRLRRALDHFYLTEGRDHRLHIVIPKGTYVPQFRSADEEASRDGHRPAPLPAAPVLRRAPRILVTPFDQEGDSGAVPGFARGFTRQVIIGLTRFNQVYVYGTETSEKIGADLRVDAPSAKTELAIDFVLSGVVCLWEDNFSVDLLLQETRSLRYIWSERFVRKLVPGNIHVLRDELAAIVAQRLAQPYGVLFSRALDEEGPSPESLDGYRAVVEFYQYVRSFRKDLLEPVRRRLEGAIEQDPTFGEGHACLSMLYSQHVRFMSLDKAGAREFNERAVLLARQAIILAPNSSNAHHALALAYWFSGDVPRSLDSYRTALSLNPADTDIMGDLGLRYCLLMDWEHGVPLVEESYRRNPCQSSAYRIALALYHFSEGQYEEGLRQAELLDTPDIVYSHLVVAACAVRLGLHDKARESVDRVEGIEPDYAQRVAFDLNARHVHPALAQDLMAAFREAGLGRRLPPAGARRT